MKRKQTIALLLVLCMMLTMTPSWGFAQTPASSEPQAECSHLTHDADCGYREGPDGSPCTHECGEDCGVVPQPSLDEDKENPPDEDQPGIVETPADEEMLEEEEGEIPPMPLCKEEGCMHFAGQWLTGSDPKGQEYAFYEYDYDEKGEYIPLDSCAYGKWYAAYGAAAAAKQFPLRMAAFNLSANVTSQSIGGSSLYNDLFKITVDTYGRISIFKKVNGSYSQKQYYGDKCNGSILKVDNTIYGTYYFYDWSSLPSERMLTVAGNSLSSDGRTITTTYNPVEGVTLTQIIEYPINSSIIRRSWEITNESGAAKSDVRFIHGGDTYFAGSDSGYCYYDNLNNMVYIRKDADSGTMAFSGDPSSPADQYYTGRYNVGVSQAVNANLLNQQTGSSQVDAGYFLQWNRSSLADGETFTIGASERFSEAGEIQIIAPAQKTVANGSLASYRFVLQNFANSNKTVTLEAESADGYPVSLRTVNGVTKSPDGTYSLAVPANGSGTVLVDCEVPEDAADGTVSRVTLKVLDNSTGTLIQSSAANMVINENTPSIDRVVIVEQTDTSVTAEVTFDNLPEGSGSGDTVRVDAQLIDSNGNPVPGTQQSQDVIVTRPGGSGNTDFTFPLTGDGINPDDTYYVKVEVEGVADPSDTASLVNNPENNFSAVREISLVPETLTLAKNETHMFELDINPANATNQNVTWRSSDPGVVSVDENGQVKALVAEGSATITALAADGSGVRGTATVTIRQTPARIDLTSSAAVLQKGETLTLQLRVTEPANYALKLDEAAFTVTGNEVTDGRNGQMPLLLASEKTLSTDSVSGVTTITWTAVANDSTKFGESVTIKAQVGGCEDSVSLQVVNKIPTGIAVALEDVSVDSLTVNKGAVITAKALLLPEGAELDPANIYWEAKEGTGAVSIGPSTNPVTGEAACEVTGVKAGQAQLVVGITGTQIQKIVTVDVKYPVTGIEVKPPVAAPEGEAAQVWSGETLQMGVSYTPVDASDRSVKWSVTGPATIGEDTGLLKINNDAASNAVVTVTAKLAADANITDSYSFTVQAALESLDIQGPAQLKKGQTAEYSIQYNPVDWQYVQTITWDLIGQDAEKISEGFKVINGHNTAYIEVKAKADTAGDSFRLKAVSSKTPDKAASLLVGIIQSPLTYSLKKVEEGGEPAQTGGFYTELVKLVFSGVTEAYIQPLATAGGAASGDRITVTAVGGAAEYTIPEGTNYLRVSAKDADGCITEAKEETIKIDLTGPGITVQFNRLSGELTPADILRTSMRNYSTGAYEANKQVEVKAILSDGVSGPKEAYIILADSAEGKPAADDSRWKAMTADTGAYTSIIDKEFTGSVYVKAVDNVGNDTISDAYEVKIAISYDVVYTLTNHLSKASGVDVIDRGGAFSATLAADAAAGYQLPETIAVTMGGVSLVAGEGYTYSKTTGEVNIASVTGDVTITAAGVPIPAIAPSITTQPAPETEMTAGEISGSLTVAATAEAGHSLSYQWYVADSAQDQGVVISGATGDSFPLPETLSGGTYYYYCVVTATRTDNGETASTVSAQAKVTVELPAEAPQISVSPQDAVVIAGEIIGSLTVTATVAAGHSLSYQWYQTRSADAEGEAVAGATGSSFTLPEDLTSGTYYYYCVVKAVRDENGKTANTKSRAAEITVQNKVIYNLTHLGKNADAPQAISNGETLTVTLAGTATHSLPETIAVTMGGVNLAAGVGYTYDGNTGLVTVPNVAGKVEVTAAGSALPATAPQIVTEPAAETLVTAGEINSNLTIVATAEAGHDLSYQWYQTDSADAAGTAITGADKDIYAIPGELTPGTYHYYCVVTAKRTDNESTAQTKSQVAVVMVQNKVTYDLTNLTVNVDAPAAISNGETLEVILTASNGFGLPQTIAVTMGGAPLTLGSGYNFDRSNGKVTVQNVTGAVVINAAGLENPAVKPSITQQPAKETMVVAGDISGSLTVTATEVTGHDLSYQWYQTSSADAGGEAVPNATGYRLTLPEDLLSGTYYYYCVVTSKRTDNDNTAETKSDVAMVIVQNKVTYDLTNLTVEADAPKAITNGESLTVTLTPDGGYRLAATIMVTMGGEPLTVESGYTYDQETGAVTISQVMGAIIVQAKGEKIIGGILTDQKGNPVPGAEIILKGEDGTIAGSTITKEDGSYELPKVPEGDYELIIKKGDQILEQGKITVDAAGAITTEDPGLDIGENGQISQVQPPVPTEDLNPVDGLVTDSEGNPIGGAEVTLTGTGENKDDVFVTETGEDGRFQVEVPDGEYQVTVTKPGTGGGADETLAGDLTVKDGVVAEGTITDSDGNPSGEISRPKADVTGTIHSGDDNVPVGGAEVILRGEDGAVIGSVVTEEDGSFEIPDVYPGDYELIIKKGDQVLDQGEITVEPDGSLTVPQGSDLTIGENGSISGVTPPAPGDSLNEVGGTITSEDGKPVGNGEVIFTDKNNGDNRYETETDKDGNFVIQVPDGDYSVEVIPGTGQGEPSVQIPDVTVEEGKLTETQTPGGDVTIKPASTITFDLNGGTPAEGAIYVLTLETGKTLKAENKTLPASPSKSGYNFAGWFGNASGQGSKFTVDTVVTESLTLYAKWNKTGGGGGSGGGGSTTEAEKPVKPSVTLPDKTEGGSAEMGSDGKTLIITPAEGYEVEDVLIDGKSVGAVKEYVFTDSEKHTVEVLYKKAEAPSSWTNPYGDVSSSSWYYESVQFVSESGLFKGVTEDSFGPDEPMTRAMFVTVLWRMDGEKAPTSKATFTDVPQNAWYAKAAAWGVENGVVKGVSESAFAPDRKVSRQEMAAFMNRYAEYKGKTYTSGDLTSFTDRDQIAAWAYEDMAKAVGAGLIGGKAHGRLDPRGTATRAETAAVLQRFSESM